MENLIAQAMAVRQAKDASDGEVAPGVAHIRRPVRVSGVQTGDDGLSDHGIVHGFLPSYARSGVTSRPMSDWRDGVTVRDRIILFQDGWPSQDYPSRFELGGIGYNCCTQWMAAEKARVFGDQDLRDQILATDDPRRQRDLGRRVRGFRHDKWDGLCREIAFIGNLMKYTHDEELGKMLLATGNLHFAKAGSDDLIWGTGLPLTDQGAVNPTKWRGKNWLGQTLLDVRTALREEQTRRL